jgi:hypothetical protein
MKGLTKFEVDISDEKGVDASPKETGLKAPVPHLRIHLPYDNDIDKGDIGNKIHTMCKGKCFKPESRRWYLSSYGINDRADYVPCNREESKQSSSREGLRLR